MSVFAISALQGWISFFSDDASHYVGSLPRSLSLLDRDTTGSPNRPLEGVLSQAQQKPLEARTARLFLPAGGEARVSVGFTSARSLSSESLSAPTKTRASSLRAG